MARTGKTGLISRARRALAGGVGCLLAMLALAGEPSTEGEAPQVRALLEQGWMVESGRGLRRNPVLAAALYRQAGQLGSGEGYFRAALIYLPDRRVVTHGSVAACYLAAASQLGHREAAEILERSQQHFPGGLSCDDDLALPTVFAEFDLLRYVESLPKGRREIVGLIRRLAPRYLIDVRLALAMASVESNFRTNAVSPKSAMGVMQLIPATAERFGVLDPFDPEQNIRGGLAYLRWLKNYYKGDVVRMVAAYNAGEGAVDAYGGIPPYVETQAYVVRVLHFSGLGLHLLPPTGAGAVAELRGAGAKKMVRR